MLITRCSGRIIALQLDGSSAGCEPVAEPSSLQVTVQLDSRPREILRFKLRDRESFPTEWAILALLQDAHSRRFHIMLEYEPDSSSISGQLVRIRVSPE